MLVLIDVCPCFYSKRGCGVFRGDPELKFVIQWIAASLSGRPLIYCTFDDSRVSEIKDFIRLVVSHTPSVGVLFKSLVASLKFKCSIWRSVSQLLRPENAGSSNNKSFLS